MSQHRNFRAVCELTQEVLETDDFSVLYRAVQMNARRGVKPWNFYRVGEAMPFGRMTDYFERLR